VFIEERLRIIPADLWQKVRKRMAGLQRTVGGRVRKGGGLGAGPKWLFSGLLRCACCGSAYAMSGHDRYSCTGRTGGGVALCKSSARLKRTVVEADLLSGIKKAMLDPAVINEIVKRYRAALRNPRPSAAHIDDTRAAQLRTQIEHLADAIAQHDSPVLVQRLQAAETELAQLEARRTLPPPASNVVQLPAQLRARAERAVQQLEATLAAGDLPRAREEIRARALAWPRACPNRTGVPAFAADEIASTRVSHARSARGTKKRRNDLQRSAPKRMTQGHCVRSQPGGRTCDGPVDGRDALTLMESDSRKVQV
jgi:site-specific DNA recombinase